MRHAIETLEKGDYKAEIFQDEDSESPRERDNIGVMFCSHKRYHLGDEQIKSANFNGWDEIEEYLVKERHAVVILPLYLFDHSGITISTSSERFRACDGAGWDWGRVGFIYATAEKVKKEYGDKPDAVERATKYLEGEVKTYDDFLTGNVYGVSVTKADKCDHDVDHREHVDDCWGLVGFEYAKEEAQRMLDEAVKPKEAANG
jgi:hypothetical protein